MKNYKFKLNNVYIAPVGKFEGYITERSDLNNGKPWVDFEELERAKFLLKNPDGTFIDLNGKEYASLTYGNIPESKIGVVEPKNFCDYFNYDFPKNIKISYKQLKQLEELGLDSNMFITKKVDTLIFN